MQENFYWSELKAFCRQQIKVVLIRQSLTHALYFLCPCIDVLSVRKNFNIGHIF